MYYPCRIEGCPDEAAFICLMDRGCACYPNDHVQLLCPHHAPESEPIGGFESRLLHEAEPIGWLVRSDESRPWSFTTNETTIRLARSSGSQVQRVRRA